MNMNDGIYKPSRVSVAILFLYVLCISLNKNILNLNLNFNEKIYFASYTHLHVKGNYIHKWISVINLLKYIVPPE